MRSNSTPAGLFIGLTTFDLVHYVERFPREDEKVQALTRWTGAGGPAANAAITFAGLGGRAMLLTAIGDGPLAEAALSDLSALGVKAVDLAGEGSLATSSAVVDGAGQRTVVSLNAKGFDQEALIGRLPSLEPVDVVVLDSHYPALVDAALARLQDPPVPIVFDPGSSKPQVPGLMDKSDHVIASRSLDPGKQPDVLLEQVEGHDVVLAAVSCGSDPILATVGDERFEIAVPEVAARDTVGAGDVLHGSYAYYVAAGHSIREALEQASVVAARSCEHHGPRLYAEHA